MGVLKQSFFTKNSLEVAKNLLGKTLKRKIGGEIISARIVETEAYRYDDPSCHAYKNKKTPRNSVMFEKGGVLYVYFTYGMHFCANVVTEEKNSGCAVLIRAVEPIGKFEYETNGPAKLCKALGITKELNGVKVYDKKSKIWFEDGIEIDEKDIAVTTRIGIKEGAELPWRFYIKGNKFVSKYSLKK